MVRTMRLYFAPLLTFASACTVTEAFTLYKESSYRVGFNQQTHRQRHAPQSSALYDTTFTATRDLSASKRDMQSLQSWAIENGIIIENGFTLTQITNEDGKDEDWSVSLCNSGTEATRLLQIPKHMLWSSKQIQKEEFGVSSSDEDDNSPPNPLQASIDYLYQAKCQYQIPQFYLALKLLREYELEEDSKWSPWIQSLPRNLVNSTALGMTPLELECLPAFAWSLASLEQQHLKSLVQAVQMIPNQEESSEKRILKEETKHDTQLIQWAFSVIFTRCWGPEDGDDEDDSDNDKPEDNPVDIVPMGDMFNHGYPANVMIDYDEEGNCNIILKENVTVQEDENAPLCLSYGRPTNPSRFLAIFGFVDTQTEHIFCQVLVDKPSQRHVDMGYATDKMVVSTIDGSIAEEVWDVVLYSILEQVPQLQEAFYQAHVSGNKVQKQALKEQFAIETGIMLKRHVDRTVEDLSILLDKIDAIDKEEYANNPQLPMIRLHNAFVRDTFAKVQGQIKEFLMAETKKRKQQQEQHSQQQ